VDVDTEKPDIHLLSTEAGIDENGRTLTIRWSATDRNLVARPVTLFYADNPDGVWMPFAMNLENTGHYVWRMSPGMPSRVLVRISATDRVGNLGQDQSMMAAPIDGSTPTVTIKDIKRNGVIVPVGSR